MGEQPADTEKLFVALLRHIAKESGVRVKRCNLYDSNVCVSPMEPHRPWEVEPLPGDLFSHQLRLVHGRRRIILRANREFLVVDVRDDFILPVGSVNRRDIVMGTRRAGHCQVELHEYPVYAAEGRNAIEGLIDSPSFRQVIRNLGLGSNESLHFCCNGLTAYVCPTSPARVLEVIEALERFAEQQPNSPPESSSKTCN